MGLNTPSNHSVDMFDYSKGHSIYIRTVKVIREKSRGEGSLIVQDTIENVSEPKLFLKLFKKKNYIF